MYSIKNDTECRPSSTRKDDQHRYGRTTIIDAEDRPSSMRRTDLHRCGGPTIIDAEDRPSSLRRTYYHRFGEPIIIASANRFSSILRLLALVLFTLAFSRAGAQQTANHYTDKYSGTTISNVSIQHKAAKWYGFRREGVDYHDSFDERNSMTTTLNGVEIQATNTYVDTIYMHKGTSINIEIPQTNNLGGESSSKGYNLWYDFRTGGTLYCNYRKNLFSSRIYDLLTLQDTGSGQYYRFANGYAGGLDLTSSDMKLHKMTFYYPTDAEFKSMKSSNSSFQAVDNDYYVLACDVSLYNDCAAEYHYGGSEFGSANGWYEPTLTGRDLFYIIGVEDDEGQRPSDFAPYWNLTKAEYQGGGNDEGTKYLEEYEMTFPARHLSNQTYELVALTKDAQAYAIPNESENASAPLTATFATNDNENGLLFSVGNEASALTSCEISGTTRVIQFYKDNGNNRKPWKVDDGSTATILVTKVIGNKTYNIARYRLTFKEESSPLTQTQVDRLDRIVTPGETVSGEYWWDDLRERSSIYMKSNFMLLTSLKFDYADSGNAANVFNGGKDEFYAFPLAWDNCGYAFYDGSANDDVNSGQGSYDINGTRSYTQWGMYSIVNKYIGYGTGSYVSPPANTGKDDTGYWMYIDASDRPGSIAELTFDEKLCQGSKLYVSGWLKGESTNDDGAVLLTIMGVTKNADGTETHTPIHRHCSGQMRLTNQLSNSAQPDEPTPPSDVTGKGSGHNEWWQFFFTFVNPGTEDYDYYTLKVENYCASSTGGDFDIDDIEVYVMHPSVEVAQIDPICTTDDEKSLVRMDLDYESIMSRLGYETTDYVDTGTDDCESIDFIVINKARYYNYLAAVAGEPTNEDKMLAIQASIVAFWDGDESVDKETGTKYPTLNFYLDYNRNTKYIDEQAGYNRASVNGGYLYRRTTETGAKELSVDCYTDMSAYTEYIIILEPHNDYSETDDEKALAFASIMDDACAISREFFLTSTTLLKINGETADPTADYCAGQTLVVAPEVTYTDEGGETINVDGVFFDWFFGTREEYVAENEEFNGVSLRDALQAFRTLYPDAEELSEYETPVNEREEFTEDCYNIIAYYLQEKRSGSETARLILHTTHLDISIMEAGLEMVIQPIAVYMEDASGQPLAICFGYVPLTLLATGVAPTLKPGFSNINYPANDYEPCLRLGLEQFERCGESNPFTINLHGATYVTEDGVSIDHLGVAEGMDMLFLVDTDDPAYHERLLEKEDGDEMAVGKVVRLYAKNDNSNDPRSDAPNGVTGSYMQIYFNVAENDANGWTMTPFTVSEGYYYVLSVYFQEKGPFNEGEEAMGSACWGTFPLEMKIVPEHLVWTGGKTDNWNNDNHWRRADKEELNKPATDTYLTNEANGTDKGFVPMLFSKLIIPANSTAELYMAGFKEGTDGMLTWQGDEDSANHDDVAEHPTGNIMYDLMMYENPTTGALKTEHFRVNLCDEIHFDPGAQLLHSEQLIYRKAWTEVEVPQGPWLLTSTPLRDVVSGDWYTKTSGKETAEYFKDIVFNDDENSRLNPMVYQRNWSNEGNTIVYTNATESKDVPAYVSTGWSSVYNDASVTQQAGEGFSIKASRQLNQDGTTDDESNLTFRFPKADTSYDAATEGITRTNAGRLLISDFVSRDDPDGDDESVYTGAVNVSLTQTGEAGNEYYIIGNPYTAPMSMSAFMAANERIKGYWTESTLGPIAGNGQFTSLGTEDCLVEPYGAFFVTTDADDLTRAGAELTVTFTKDMQTEKAISTTSLSSLSIRATGAGGTTSAAVVFADDATDDYDAREDAMVMEDVSWKREGMPMVYSVAGDKAVSVNTLRQLTLIPIGAFADDADLYTLTFVGVENMDEPTLVDTYEATETELSEGFTLDVEGSTHGRYYIRVKTPVMTDIEDTASHVGEVSAYSPVSRTVVVSADAGLEDVEIYSIGGMLLRRASAGGNVSCTMEGVPSGIAIVKAKTAEGTVVKKIRVR